MSEKDTYLDQTLKVVSTKINGLLIPLEAGQPCPVDCVAFGFMYTGFDDRRRVTSYHYPTCSHPDRGGDQANCLLVKVGADEGEITRIHGRICPYQIKEHQRGAAELRRRIGELNEPKF